MIRNNYFLFCFVLQGINGILADEMGLGKTVQSIAFLSYLAEVCFFLKSTSSFLISTAKQVIGD